MSLFVKNHVSRVFGDGGYELLEIYGDRGGIVQGDGLHLVVTPDISAAARRFSSDEVVIARIENDARDAPKLKLSLYGGSASADLEGIWLSEEFVTSVKEHCVDLYYAAQADINAIFDAEDAPDRNWDGSRDAYVGAVVEFAMQPLPGERSFVRVLRIADQSFNAYESGDDEADREDVSGIIDGDYSHGTVEIHIYDIEPTGYRDDGDMAFDRDFAEDAYRFREFRHDEPSRVISGTALVWKRDVSEKFTFELAAELAADDGEDAVAKAIRERVISHGLQVDAQDDTAVSVAAP
jgi:hypothetical protein